MTCEVCKVVPIDLRDSNGSTLLHKACELNGLIRPNDEYSLQWLSLIISILLKRGVKLELRNQWGQTAYDLLLDQQYVEISLMAKSTDDENYRPMEEEVNIFFDLVNTSQIFKYLFNAIKLIIIFIKFKCLFLFF